MVNTSNSTALLKALLQLVADLLELVASNAQLGDHRCHNRLHLNCFYSLLLGAKIYQLARWDQLAWDFLQLLQSHRCHPLGRGCRRLHGSDHVVKELVGFGGELGFHVFLIDEKD